MNLFLIRHAQSHNNAVPDRERVPDPALTVLGEEQAELTAELCRSLELTRILTSPFLRTLQTAAPIARTTAIRPEVRTVLHETGGCYSGHDVAEKRGESGMTDNEIECSFPTFVIPDDIDEQGWWKRRAFEAWGKSHDRAKALLASLQHDFAATRETVACIMHADIMVLFLSLFHSEPIDCPRNCGISRVELTTNSVQLVEYNNVDHLPDGCVTF